MSNSRLVMSQSASDGVVLPPGWLCARIIDAAPRLRASSMTVRGYTAHWLTVPSEMISAFITRFALSRNSAATYSFGGGVNLNVIGRGIRADYSYSKFETLGAVHRFGLGISF